MKRILILTSELIAKKRKFVELIKKNISNSDIKVDLKKISNTTIFLDNNNIEVYVGNKNIKEYELVYFRGVQRSSMFTVATLAVCLKKLGIKYYDTMYSETGSHRSKLASLAVLSSNKINIPKTVYFSNRQYTKKFETLKILLGIPFVAKEMSLQRGKGVHLINSLDDLKKLPRRSSGGSKNDYFFQKFIDKETEYRLLVLGDHVGVWEEKVRRNANEFRNNVALGADEIFFDPKKTPPEIADMAVKASNQLGIQVGGVDIMIEKTTNIAYLLEVNRGPGLTYDESVSPEFKQIASFLENEVA